MWERIDQTVLILFTKFSHWFQVLTGKNNYFLARVSLMVVAMNFMLSILDYWFPDLLDHSSYLITVIFMPFPIIYFWGYIGLLIECEKKSENPSDVLYQVPLPLSRKIFEISRLLFLAVFLLLEAPMIGVDIIRWRHNVIFQSVWNLTFFFLTAVCYLVDVTPLPRGKSKIRKWLEGFTFKTKPAYAPNR